MDALYEALYSEDLPSIAPGMALVTSFVGVVVVLAVVLLMLRRKLWVVWCAMVLVGRGQQRRVGPAQIRRSDRAAPTPRGPRKDIPDFTSLNELMPMARKLATFSPGFRVQGETAKILSTPAEFLDTLQGMVAGAKRRITIAALYLGLSGECHDLVETIDDVLRREPNVEVLLLLDYGRSLRRERGKTVLDLLTPLVLVHGERILVRLFMVPLCGAIFRHAPPTIREVAGVQHIKAYVVDDQSMLSGANLNMDYFTDRQDRYMIIDDAPLADWIHRFVAVLGGLSFECIPIGTGGDLAPKWPQGVPHPVWSGPSPMVYHEFCEEASSRIRSMLSETEGSLEGSGDTLVFPLVQMTPIGIEHDAALLPCLLAACPRGQWTLHLSTAYPNFTPAMCNAVTRVPCKVSVIIPGESASGFYGASGVKGLVPKMYTKVLTSFLQYVQSRGHPDISVSQWEKSQWTYHSKGLWLLNDREQCLMSLIGSSNMGHRSEDLDLELQFVVITQNPKLSALLSNEVTSILQHTSSVKPTTLLSSINADPWWKQWVVSAATAIFHPFL